ncbi:unnamed protein product [Medioppia subpectinata]|uniref:Cytochrome P450 n=1 Tax=Medioppia subpectinata TaxID=1979941 RepID=A0A7R9Q181_9ACAR|nr:unnamed protein product [Medioppia subpectinata]CAG2108804.1 unnamed protein product [Medioppia subpectinata]
MGLKGPKPIPFLGNSVYWLLKPRCFLDVEWGRKYGQIYGVYDSNQPILVVSKPELIKTIMVKDYHVFIDRRMRPTNHFLYRESLFHTRGDNWRRIRSIASPTLSSAKMRKMYPMVRQCLRALMTHVVDKECGDCVDLKKMCGNYTMDVIAAVAFGTDANAHNDHSSAFVTSARQILDVDFVRTIIVLLLPKFVVKAIGLKSRVPESANQFFVDIGRRLINERKSDPDSHRKYNDFIQFLVDARPDRDRDAAADVNAFNESEEELAIRRQMLTTGAKKHTLTDDEIVAQAWIFFLAGYDTTSTTLTYCCYELALNQDIQQRLYNEVMTSVDSEGEIGYDELMAMSYLDAVLSETLRKYPPVNTIERRSVAEYVLGDTGITLPAGQEIEIPVYSIHHNPEYYPAPENFDPERFMHKNRHNIRPYTYLPFGAGPRNCIGMRVALMEAKLCVVHLIQKYMFLRIPKTSVPIKIKISVVTLASADVHIGFTKR